jgi:hypothetical protein
MGYQYIQIIAGNYLIPEMRQTKYLYSRRSFIWQSKHQKHPNNRTVLKGLFTVINFLKSCHGNNWTTTKFYKTHTLLNLFISYHTLCPHITYHSLHAKTSFLNHCALLELRYLNSRNIINPEQVRSQIFWVNNLLLYLIWQVQHKSDTLTNHASSTHSTNQVREDRQCKVSCLRALKSSELREDNICNG